MTPTPPGTIIELRAYATADGVTTETRKRMVVLRRGFEDKVFYVCGSWRDAMPGIRVRFMQCVGRSYIPCEGVVTNTNHIFTANGGLIDLERNAGRF